MYYDTVGILFTNLATRVQYTTYMISKIWTVENSVLVSYLRVSTHNKAEFE